MNRRYLQKGVTALLMCFLISCGNQIEKERKLQQVIHQVEEQFAPDSRTTLFDIHLFTDTEKYILMGETNSPEAIAELRQTLKTANIDVVDEIEILPSKELKEKTQAVINISVANLRSNSKHSAELVTQATLGTPVKVLKKEGGWYYIQTPDKYLSWVDNGGITLMDKERFGQWQGADKVIYKNTYGHCYLGEDEEQIVSDLVAGDILETLKFGADHFIVRFPDGRTAFVRKNEAEVYNEWLDDMDMSVENLVATSKKLMGVPYLWGGTSTKGMDCSGFTKTVYFLNGMVIPRDASQQVHTGKPIDSTQNFQNLQGGDLLFFGRKATDSTAEKVVHVGMWIGNNEFIHASDRVRISSMDKSSKYYDEYNLNRYLRTKRVFNQEGKGLIHLAKVPLFQD